MTHRFQRIGGSPLMRTTAAQASALAQRIGLPVRVAGRLWGPYPAEVVADLVREGVTTLISLPLAPQSVDVYHAPVREAASAHPGLELRYAPPWGLEPALAGAFVESIDEALARFPEAERASVPVILSAHSLPSASSTWATRTSASFREMAAAVTARLAAGGEGVAPRDNPVHVAFQSQGMDGGVWLGPDLRVPSRAGPGGRPRGRDRPDRVRRGPRGDALRPRRRGPRPRGQSSLARLERAPAMNVRPRFVDALEAVVRRLL